MLQFQINVAEGLGVTQTAEFEEAYRKLTEIDTIVDRLETAKKRIKNEHKCYNFWICVAFILLGVFIGFFIYWSLKQPDMSLVIRQR